MNQPFEWLTSPASLRHCILDALVKREGLRALHVGCGTSTLGETLLTDDSFGIASVVNTDCDTTSLETSRLRWEERQRDDGKALEFRHVDYSLIETAAAKEEFDVTVDKSTLDCLLCTDAAAAHLICHVYNSLKPLGVYILISFHHVSFLRPLLEDLPESDWHVSNHVMDRQVEPLFVGNRKTEPSMLSNSGRKPPVTNTAAEACWSTGKFLPNEVYRRTVNVFVCRKRQTGSVDRQAVYEHVHKVNNQWYSTLNPMATRERQLLLAKSFQNNAEMDLASCYQVIFVEDEKEHYDFADFLSDWDAFRLNRPSLPKEGMSFETAVQFLKEMQ